MIRHNLAGKAKSLNLIVQERISRQNCEKYAELWNKSLENTINHSESYKSKSDP